MLLTADPFLQPKCFLPVCSDPEFLGDLKGAVGREGDPPPLLRAHGMGVKEKGK